MELIGRQQCLLCFEYAMFYVAVTVKSVFKIQLVDTNISDVSVLLTMTENLCEDDP